MKSKARKKTTKRTVRSVQPPPVADRHLSALLGAVCSSQVNQEYFDLSARYAQANAAAMFASKPFSTAFDLFADRPACYRLIGDAVIAWLHAPDSVMGEEKRKEAQFLESILEQDGTDPTSFKLDPMSMQSLFMEVGEQGMLLGAALMYGLLKGGAR